MRRERPPRWGRHKRQRQSEGDTITLSSLGGTYPSQSFGALKKLRAPRRARVWLLGGSQRNDPRRQLNAKRIMAKRMFIHCSGGVDGEAVYVETLHVDAEEGDVRLGAVQGDADVAASGGVFIEDMDGSVRAAAKEGHARVHFSSFGNHQKPSSVVAEGSGDAAVSVGVSTPWKADVTSQSGPTSLPPASASVHVDDSIVTYMPEKSRDDANIPVLSGKVRTEKFGGGALPDAASLDDKMVSLNVASATGAASLEVLSWKEMLTRKFLK